MTLAVVRPSWGHSVGGVFRVLLPALSLAAVLLAIAYFNPRAISYFGFNLMLNLAVPVALATIAQMLLITINDLDLSIGAYVGFTGCVVATWLPSQPVLGWAILLASICIYALLAACRSEVASYFVCLG